MQIDNYPYWLVSLNTAIKLKEIGLGVNTTDYYELNYDRDGGRFMTGLDINFEKLKETNYNVYRDYVAIPNFTQVIDWFRTKKLFGTIDYNGSGCYSYRILLMGTPSVVTDNKVYPIYSFCRNALIDKLIEVYKNEKQTK